MSNDKTREAFKNWFENDCSMTDSAKFLSKYGMWLAWQAAFTQQPESEPVSLVAFLDRVHDELLDGCETADECRQALVNETLLQKALLVAPTESAPLAEVDHDDCTLCGGCGEIETDNTADESVTVPCPECIHREIVAGMHTSPQPSPQVPEDAVRRAITHVFYVTHYVGPIQDVRRMTDEVVSLLTAAPSIAEKREPEPPEEDGAAW